MRSLLGRFHRPFARSVEEQLLLLNNLGDGSTLSLDFTTGVLDPRLTFTRSTNATFINSQGLVQYADANVFQNSETPSAAGWDGPNVARSLASITNPLGGTSSIQLQVTSPGSASTILAANLAVGFSYTVRVWVRAATSTRVSIGFLVGSFQPSVLSIVSGNGTIQGSGSGSTYHTVTGLTTDWTLLQLVITPVAAGNGALYIYPNTPTQSAGDSVYIWAAQLNIGTTANPYNRSVANGYYAPRFDYDPTTLQPRGLLIEGSASNLLNWSESFASSGAASNWAYNGNTGAVVTSSNPAGGTTAFQFAETANSGPLQQSATVTNVVHTFSAWFKASTYNSVTTTQVNFGLFTTGFLAGTASIVSGPGSTAVAGNIVTLSGLSETQWTRVQFTTTAAIPAGAVAILIYPQTTGFEVNRSFYIWGAQLETGSGASSYIPSGASQGSRALDSCVMTGTNFSSWYQSATAGTVYCEFDNPRSSLGVAQTPAPANLGDYSAGNLLSGYLGGYPVGQGFAAAVWGNGGTGFQSATVATAVSVALGNKGAFAFTGQSIVGAFRGFSSATATTTGTVNAKTVLYVGANGTGGTSTRDFLNSCIQRIKFFPTQYTAAQLQALTT